MQVLEGRLEQKWPDVSLMTQEVVDALQMSWQQDGKKVAL
jgi:hypothetical protein